MAVCTSARSVWSAATSAMTSNFSDCAPELKAGRRREPASPCRTSTFVVSKTLESFLYDVNPMVRAGRYGGNRADAGLSFEQGHCRESRCLISVIPQTVACLELGLRLNPSRCLQQSRKNLRPGYRGQETDAGDPSEGQRPLRPRKRSTEQGWAKQPLHLRHKFLLLRARIFPTFVPTNLPRRYRRCCRRFSQRRSSLSIIDETTG